MTGLSTGESYEYDENGNMTCRVENNNTYKQVYNAENRLAKIMIRDGGCLTGTVTETWSFYYDGDGNMFKQTVDPDGTTTIFIDGVYEEDRNSGGIINTRTYYPAGGAMRVTTGSASNVYYVLRDNLGSAMATLNNSGGIEGQQRYYPFGEVRSIDDIGVNTDRTYTGQRDIASLSLMDYHARMYDAYLNRWTQPDTIIPDLSNPQSLNRYAYALNDPIRYNDPTGHDPAGDCYDRGYCDYGDLTPGQLLKRYHVAKQDGVEGIANYEKLTKDIETYMEAHQDYNPMNEIDFTNRHNQDAIVFTLARRTYWEHRAIAAGVNPLMADNLSRYYDFHERFQEAQFAGDGWAIARDVAGIPLGLIGESPLGGISLGSAADKVAFSLSAANSGISVIDAEYKRDPLGLVLSGLGFIPVIGSLASTVLLGRDLSHYKYYEYTPPIPRYR